MRRRLTKTSQSQIDMRGVGRLQALFKIASKYTSDNDVPKYRNSALIPYVSRYSGGFSTLDTMRLPRPSAFASANMTAVEYYRGQNSLIYNIADENEFDAKTALALTFLSQDAELVF